MSDDDIIDFEAFKNRRVIEEIDKDEAWEGVRYQLTKVMYESGLHDNSLTSATLRALLDSLEAGDNMSRVEAKDRIARSLRMFRE